MLVGVVEDQRPAFLPVVHRTVDADGDRFARLGDDQPEVQPQQAVVGTAMRRQPRARLEHGKHRADEARHALHQPPRLRALLDVVLMAAEIVGKDEGGPAAILADGRRRTVARPDQRIAAHHQLRELAADRRPAAFEFRRPRENAAVVDLRIAVDGAGEVPPLRPLHGIHEPARELAAAAMPAAAALHGLFSFANGRDGIVTIDGVRAELFCAMMSSPT